MSHTIGIIDEKKNLRYPRQWGAFISIQKGFHAMVLLALMGTDYKFFWYDIAVAGSSSDQIFQFNYAWHDAEYHSDLHNLLIWQRTIPAITNRFRQ